MIEFLITFFIVFIKQIIFLFTFGIAISINSDGIIFMPIILLTFYLILYFKYSKKFYTQINLNKKLFDLYYFISWIIFCFLISYLIFTESWLWDILPKTVGMFSGIEYILVPLLLIVYLLFLWIIKIVIYILSKIRSKHNMVC